MEYIKLIQKRISLSTMRAYCRERNLPTSRSWTDLEDKFIELIKNNTREGERIKNELESIYRNTLTIGPRAIQIFRLADDIVAEDFYTSLETAAIDHSPFLASYPKPIKYDELDSELDENDPKLTHIETTDHSVTLTFCSRRLVEEKDRRTSSQIGDEAILKFGWQDYDEFILIKKKLVQTYEIIHFNKTNRTLEIRVEDFPGVKSDTVFNALQTKINKIYEKNNPSADPIVLKLAINFFPAIHALYASEEGLVTELGFTTLTGSAKHEKMRGNKDLRNELFHVGGKIAVHGEITPFRISIRWPHTDPDREPEEVLLPGSVRLLGTGMPVLNHVVLKGCHTESDMQAVVKRLVNHLPKKAK
jgi:hypothetical protein